MKTSLTDIVKTENYLRGELTPEESVLFQARLLIHQELRENTFFHRMVHAMVRMYYRKRMKAEAEKVHDKLFHGASAADAEFSNDIMKLFNR